MRRYIITIPDANSEENRRAILSKLLKHGMTDASWSLKVEKCGNLDFLVGDYEEWPYIYFDYDEGGRSREFSGLKRLYGNPPIHVLIESFEELNKVLNSVAPVNRIKQYTHGM